MVFANDFDRHRYPTRSRVMGIFVGTFVMVAIALALVSPRTIAVSLPLIAATALFSAWWQGRIAGIIPARSLGAGLTLVFLGLTCLSALWAANPTAPLLAALTAMFYFVCCGIAVACLMAEARHNLAHIAEGFWIGLAAGLGYLAVEIFSGQAIKLQLYNLMDVPKAWLRPAVHFTWKGDELVAISPMDLTRSIAPIPLVLWSALLTLKATAPQGRFRLFAAGMFILACVVVYVSEHETSKVALLTSALIFAIASRWPQASFRLLTVGWVVACLAVIPVSLALQRLDLHTNPLLQFSMRHRIVIWNYTAEEALRSPIVGHGAGMMYQIDPKGVKFEPDTGMPRVARHAHNVYLQTWFELGAAGAALLTLIGLSLLDRVRRVSDDIAPFAQATFASAMVMAAASYGMWQAWFIAMFAMCVVMYVIAAAINSPYQPETGSPGIV